MTEEVKFIRGNDGISQLAQRPDIADGVAQVRAALNFGDCFTYALAEQTGYPVLCTGDDFAATGISVLRLPAGNGEP